MAGAVPTASSTREATNYARLCRLLVDVGTQALRDMFNAIHSPANLHTVLAGSKATLQPLRARKVINPTQWGKLFPAIPSSVSSASFDITLLMVLLRNICGLAAPATGWDALPAATDVSVEADIARVKYFRNTVYAHADQACVDDATFSSHWNSIRDTLVRLGGVTYGAAIDHLETECMDPEAEEHYIELLRQWKKDEDNVKEKLEEILKKLDDLEVASVVVLKDKTTDKGNVFKLEKMTYEADMCKEKNHDNEVVEYFCTDCKVCICHKCGETIHNHHNKRDIRQEAEERRTKMTKLFDKVQARIVDTETRMKKQTELMKKSEDEICFAQKEMTETVEESIRLLNEHRKAMTTKLAQICAARHRKHSAKMENFETFAALLKSSLENGEAIVRRSSDTEILQVENAVYRHCEQLLNAEEIQIYKPSHVSYLSRRSVLASQVVTTHNDPSEPTAEGKDLKDRGIHEFELELSSS